MSDLYLDKFKISDIFKDIRFWIILFFIIRLYGITNPPLEVSHAWRQATVNMVARNFFEIDNNIFYPRIDVCGEKTGITGMEFPALNYLIYLASEIFDYDHWYGRLINLIISSIGLLAFFHIVRSVFSRSAAFYSTLLLSASIWFQFSRNIMPDTFAVSFVIMAILFGQKFFDQENGFKKALYLTGYILAAMIGLLAKLPAGYLLSIFILHLFLQRYSTNDKIKFIGASALSVLPALIWYFYWVPYLNTSYGLNYFFMGKNLAQGFEEISQMLGPTLHSFYFDAMKYTGFLAFLFGSWQMIKSRRLDLILAFCISFGVFIITMLKSGSNFPVHDYYIIPFVPVMALVAGYGLSHIKNKTILITLVSIILIENLANQLHHFTIKDNHSNILNLEDDLNEVTKHDDLIVINSTKNPTPLYFSHRKGWVADNMSLKDPIFIDSLKNKGLKAIVILNKAYGDPVKLDKYDKAWSNEDYSIYRVD